MGLFVSFTGETQMGKGSLPNCPIRARELFHVEPIIISFGTIKGLVDSTITSSRPLEIAILSPEKTDFFHSPTLMCDLRKKGWRNS